MRMAGEHGHEEGLKLAQELLNVGVMVQGVYLMPSYGRYDVVSTLAQMLPKCSRLPEERQVQQRTSPSHLFAVALGDNTRMAAPCIPVRRYLSRQPERTSKPVSLRLWRLL